MRSRTKSRSTTRTRTWRALAPAVIAVTAGMAFGAIGTGAIGTGVAGAAPAAKSGLSAYCTQLQRMGEEFGDPGIDAIFENNPNPTLAQWAAFLPGPVERMRTFADDIDALDAPEQVAGDAAAVVKRLRAVVTMFDDAQRAAAAGDQATFDKLGARRDGLVRKLGKAFKKVEKACRTR